MRACHRVMKIDSASHILRQQVSFELFLFFYLVCALLLQKINIYKTNFHLIDLNLVLFTVFVLGRRLGWSVLQELQSHWGNNKPPAKLKNGKKSTTMEARVNIKHVMVVLSTLLVIAWSVVRLIQHTSLFNLLFLFYPLLLYLSLFGFTLEPRPYRSRFEPPKTFLEHIDFTTPERQKWRTKIFSQSNEVTTITASTQGSTNTPSTAKIVHSPSAKSGKRDDNEEAPQTSFIARLALGNLSGDKRYSWEYALMLPTFPEEVRSEVDILLADLIVRLKQLLFNSLLCAYYVGFIPMLFADSHLFYNKWWCIEHVFLVWANSFVILSSLLLPPSYCQLLYQCALHLGCWTRCAHDQNTNTWSPNVIWHYDTVVQWNGESFKGEGLYNMAIPCDSSQEFFYLLFQSRLHVHSWLLTMQSVTVLFQLVVLLRSIYWFQLLSMSTLLLFNSFVFYKLLHNRLWSRRTPWLTS